MVKISASRDSPCPKRADQNITMGEVLGFILAEVPKFFKPLDQGMVACDYFHPAIWVNGISAAVPHMSNGDLLTEHQRGCDCGPRCPALHAEHIDALPKWNFPSLPEANPERLRGQVVKIGMKLFGNISAHNADGCIARHFTKLMPAHSIGNDIQGQKGTLSVLPEMVEVIA
jgi:hypothetical protein